MSLSDTENGDEHGLRKSSDFSQIDTSTPDSSSSDEFTVHQLDGSGDFSGLAGIQCESDVMSAIINIFRNFEDVWDTLKRTHTLLSTTC